MSLEDEAVLDALSDMGLDLEEIIELFQAEGNEGEA